MTELISSITPATAGFKSTQNDPGTLPRSKSTDGTVTFVAQNPFGTLAIYSLKGSNNPPTPPVTHKPVPVTRKPVINYTQKNSSSSFGKKVTLLFAAALMSFAAIKYGPSPSTLKSYLYNKLSFNIPGMQRLTELFSSLNPFANVNPKTEPTFSFERKYYPMKA